ncbi:MAG: DEAD/DEAH box helicase [Sphingomonadales bacterium]|nr:DEAD/DEAH box helicase [Sphingomonadales bacterium]
MRERHGRDDRQEFPLSSTEPGTITEPETPSVDPTDAPTFAELGTGPLIVEALAADGITHAFPIQQQCIPLALDGTDLIGQAKTGTGKTLGFGIPLLQRIAAPGTEAYAALPPESQGRPQALVVCPTRELGLQVATDLQRRCRTIEAYGWRLLLDAGADMPPAPGSRPAPARPAAVPAITHAAAFGEDAPALAQGPSPTAWTPPAVHLQPPRGQRTKPAPAGGNETPKP